MGPSLKINFWTRSSANGTGRSVSPTLTRAALFGAKLKAFVQSLAVNRLSGGMRRKFSPLPDGFVADLFVEDLLRDCATICETASRFEPPGPQIGIHMIRTEAVAERSAYPAPEGVHRDGFRFISMHLINMQNLAVDEASSSLFDNDGRLKATFKLRAPGDSLFVDDTSFKHYVDPFHPLMPQFHGIRDMLVFTYGPALV